MKKGNLFSFLGRQNKKKGTLGSIISEKSVIDASKRGEKSKLMESRMSILTSGLEMNKEEIEQNKTEKLLEQIISKFQGENKTELSDYCIENNNQDLNFLIEMNNTNKELSDFNFTSPKEEGEKFQLVEKSIVDKYREENTKYSESIQKLKIKIADIKEKLFKATGENNFVKQASDYQNTLKSDNAKQLKNMEKMLNDCIDQNKKLREELIAKQIQKDSLFRAVYTYIKKYNDEMANEFKNIYQCYNNQYYMINRKGIDEKYIEELFSQIHVLERKIHSKNKEIKELERYLVVPDKTDPKKKVKPKNKITITSKSVN